MRAIYSIFLMFFSGLTFGQTQVTLEGELKNLDNHPIVVFYQVNNKNIKDTIVTHGNRFKFTIPVTAAQEISMQAIGYPKTAIIGSKLKSYMYVPPILLFVVPGDQLTLKGDALRICESTVEGGISEKPFEMLNSKLAPLITKDHLLTIKQVDYLNKGDKVASKAIAEERSKLTIQKNRLTIDFITANPNSLFSIFKFSQKVGSLQPDQVEKLFATYPQALRESVFGRKIKEFIEVNNRTLAGQKMIDFSGPILDGKHFDSKSLRGKYILLDFWGSWCKPCRASHPHLLDIYQKYKGKGFEIVGIAYEMSNDPLISWSKAVKEDQLNWIHLLSNQLKKQENQDLILAYNVKAFPTKILINREGVILWKGVGGSAAELDKELLKIFGE